MSCNDYTIELIATQLVIPENNTAGYTREQHSKPQPTEQKILDY
jgi:hypothetical protein